MRKLSTRVVTIASGTLLLVMAACTTVNLDRRENLQGPRYTIGEVYRNSLNYNLRSTLIVFAFSGGGKRSAAFGYGALQGAREIKMPDGTHLSDNIDIVSGVSGGSFTAAAFAIHHDALFGGLPAGETYDDFLTTDLTAEIVGIYAEPWRWGWLVHDNIGTNDEMADVYENGFFTNKPRGRGYTFGDLITQGRPYLIIQATDLDDRMPFTFTQNDFDLICTDLSGYRVARALAASNGFPLLFSPIGVQMYSFTGTWHEKRPPDFCPRVYSRDDYSVDASNQFTFGGQLNAFENNLHPAFDQPASQNMADYLHLADGGLSDNLALHGVMDLWTRVRMQFDEPSGTDCIAKTDATLECEDVASLNLNQIKTILIVSVDGEAEPDRATNLNVPVISGVSRIVDSVSNAVIDSDNLQTIPQAFYTVQSLADTIGTLKCPKTPEACRPYAVFAHVSLADWAKAPGRSRSDRDVADSATGLSLSSKEEQLLVAAGREAFVANAQNREISCFVTAVGGEPPPASCPQRTADR
jgi:NTE family protein